VTSIFPPISRQAEVTIGHTLRLRRHAMPNLLAALISFHTNDDDKDGDTFVTVTLREPNGIIAARIADSLGHFNDNSISPNFALNVLDPADKDRLLSGTITLRIDPNGNDTWRFNYLLNLIFNDGSSISFERGGLDLSEDNRQVSFALAS
jgi:hypothetical protein